MGRKLMKEALLVLVREAVADIYAWVIALPWQQVFEAVVRFMGC